MTVFIQHPIRKKTITVCDVPSRAFHHSANPLYPIFLLSHPFSTSGHLSSSKRAISVTAPRLWNDLPPELRTFSLPPPSSFQIIKHHLHHAPLSVTPGLPLETEVPALQTH